MTQQASSFIRIVRLTGVEHESVFSAMETLHREELSAGTLAHMPHGFLRRFYMYMAAQRDLDVLGAFNGARIVGFVSGSFVDAHLFRLVRQFASSNPGTMVAVALRLVGRPTDTLRLIRLASSL